MRFWPLAVLVVACNGDDGVAPDGGSDVATDITSDALDSSLDASLDVIEEPSGPFARVRVMSANLTSGTQQSYEDPGIRIFQGLHPDVVLIQEFKYASGLPALVDTAFGAGFSYYVEPSGNIPNGIVSRYPILDAGSWTDASVTDRSFVWARIDVPGPVELFAVSLHLLTTGVTQRDTEAKELVAYVMANAPAADYLVIGGDLNTDATTEDALVDLGALVDVTPPYPVDQQGNAFSSTNRNRPHDWVLAGPSLRARQVSVDVGLSSFPAGLIFDSRVYTPLSDVAPILITDSGATGMQHMPVVREFALDPDSVGDAAADATIDATSDASDDADAAD